ncbi:MAG: Brp/Blh family beta-carotene 15,15'-dioxygenase [Sphingomicrobium sp.]
MVGILGLIESSNANGFGRHRNVPPASDSTHPPIYPAIAVIVTIVAALVPTDRLTGPTVITATCSAILIGGLPHGALDLAVLRRDACDGIAMVIGLYLSLAAIMFAIWQIVPVLALAVFLAMAMTHFADDWSDSEHPFFALGIAVALLSAPTLFHHGAVSGLFVLLSGKPAASVLADTLLLVAPAAVACAMLATLLLWHGGHRVTAVNAVSALAAMILLPPITGFAIYFCLIHSPSHFRAGLRRLGSASSVSQSTIVATLGGLAIALATVQFLPLADPSSRLFAASFMTLSILTLPHMAVPLILRRLGLNARA